MSARPQIWPTVSSRRAPSLLAGGISLRVRDMNAALAFYTQVLGLPLGLAVQGYAQVDACGLVIELYDGGLQGGGPADGQAAPAAVSIGLRVDDLEQAVQCLAMAGVACRLEEDARERRAHFHDPDGTPLCLVERK